MKIKLTDNQTKMIEDFDGNLYEGKFNKEETLSYLYCHCELSNLKEKYYLYIDCKNIGSAINNDNTVDLIEVVKSFESIKEKIENERIRIKNSSFGELKLLSFKVEIYGTYYTEDFLIDLDEEDAYELLCKRNFDYEEFKKINYF